ncbi:hypothetical protein BSLG_003402 [Batrachochytrium salamandrivorans]|nr:hypothetical protein BSLG_003402 [Batrachochytrium salamandrivorans]
MARPSATSTHSLITAWLIAYNVASFAGWAYVLYQISISMVYSGGNYEASYASVVHAFVGAVKSPVGTTAMQVASRLFLIALCYLLPNTGIREHVAFTTMVLAWSITEVRAMAGSGFHNKRIPGESVGILFLVFATVVLYMSGLYIMYTYMIRQRSKYLNVSNHPPTEASLSELQATMDSNSYAALAITAPKTANQKIVVERGLTANDTRVIVSGCDIDGLQRAKVVSLDKVLKSLDDGFGFCSVLFAWDQHDALVQPPPPLMAANSGFSDIVAKIDPLSLRRIPWSSNQALMLVDFHHPETGAPLAMCPRSLLKRIVGEFRAEGMRPLAGMEYEWFNFKETPETLVAKKGVGLQSLTPGMFGYSLMRPHLHQDFFNGIFDHCLKMGIPIEGLHTETGPGVYEAALEYTDALELADRAHLFKMVVKQAGLASGIMSCFMAKPHQDQPGCSGHIHISLQSLSTGKSLFTPPTVSTTSTASTAPTVSTPSADRSTTNTDVSRSMTPTMQMFIAGILAGLPSIMAILAPTINRELLGTLTVSYGMENRTTAIRIIGPPISSPSATRIEVRVPGADVNPYLAVAAILACGLDGIRKQLPLPFPPADGNVMSDMQTERLPRTLLDAVQAMTAAGSMARRVLGDEFVDHYAATRMHEWRLWSSAVTDWELKRYMETV